MPITVIASVGSRTADSVTVSTVTSTTVTGYTNAWSVVLSATVPTTTKIGDKLTTGANSYLITGISSSMLTVIGDSGVSFTSTSTPSTGSATTARSYSSPDLWSSGAPASLVSKDWIWKGEVYKEGSGTNNEYVLGSQFVDVPITFNATSDATRYYIMTTASGQSFRDNANKLTNSLRYTPANGVAINIDGAYSNITGGAKVIISNLQLRMRNPTISYFAASSGGSVTFDSCIISPQTAAGILESGNVVNSVILGFSGFSNGNTNSLIACTLIGAGGNFGTMSSGSATIRNCAIFNFTSIGISVNAANSTYNATNLASFGWSGTGNIVSKTYANQFENVGSGTEDFRVKSGADLINAGVRDQTYTSDLDIVGQARSITTPTIGAWEFISGVVTPTDYASAFSRGMFRGIDRGTV